MTKTELLKKVHALIWKNDDYMNQEELFELQHLIDSEIVREARKGNITIRQHSNGYICSMI